MAVTPDGSRWRQRLTRSCGPGPGVVKPSPTWRPPPPPQAGPGRRVPGPPGPPGAGRRRAERRGGSRGRVGARHARADHGRAHLAPAHRPTRPRAAPLTTTHAPRPALTPRPTFVIKRLVFPRQHQTFDHEGRAVALGVRGT